jgi:hypothetical protein
MFLHDNEFCTLMSADMMLPHSPLLFLTRGILEPCHVSILNPCHYSILDPCHFSILEPCHFSILDPCHFSILDPCHFFILDPYHFSILEPCHFFIFDSCHFYVLDPCHFPLQLLSLTFELRRSCWQALTLTACDVFHLGHTFGIPLCTRWRSPLIKRLMHLAEFINYHTLVILR